MQSEKGSAAITRSMLEVKLYLESFILGQLIGNFLHRTFGSKIPNPLVTAVPGFFAVPIPNGFFDSNVSIR